MNVLEKKIQMKKHENVQIEVKQPQRPIKRSVSMGNHASVFFEILQVFIFSFKAYLCVGENIFSMRACVCVCVSLLQAKVKP